jgi:hypothetical protein
VISSSSRLLMTRINIGSGRIGYGLKRLVATPGPSGYSVTVSEVARYCVSGAKPAFSFDERWVTYQHYLNDSDAVALGFTGPDDPGFAQYRSQGASNIYVLDLLTGQSRRVTHMHPGQYALYPHFRSDGWIYFIVRTLDSDHEEIVASDAALTLESAP